MIKQIERQCAYCQGLGKDPFGILSARSTCGVCGGTGSVQVPESYIKCAHCKGTGAVKRFSCTVCHGTGVVYREVKPLQVCPTCRGSGDDFFLPALECLKCHGRGWLKLGSSYSHLSVENVNSSKLQGVAQNTTPTASPSSSSTEPRVSSSTVDSSSNRKENTTGVNDNKSQGTAQNTTPPVSLSSSSIEPHVSSSTVDSSSSNRKESTIDVHDSKSQGATQNTTPPVSLSSSSTEPRVSSTLNDGLIAYYPFEGNADDVSGNQLQGTVHGATLVIDRFGRPHSAYHFNGKGDKIIVKDAPLLNFGINDFSIMAWIKMSQAGIWKRIITKRANSSSWYSLAISNGRSVFEICPGGNLLSTSNVNDGVWHFIGVVRGHKTFSMYVDGALQSTMVDNGRDLNSPGSNLEIGVWGNESYDSGMFTGDIDDVRLYNRALSAEEVKQIYQLTTQSK